MEVKKVHSFQKRSQGPIIMKQQFCMYFENRERSLQDI
jgi:hypothetical protein